ncbi:MAG: PEPxxWA-CTERM sorting domain-containing protein [Sphingomonadales bacterium]|nr:PEPxxWA-CTERM sorting domain-containing protein [Sphingomonadales bacterium]
MPQPAKLRPVSAGCGERGGGYDGTIVRAGCAVSGQDPAGNATAIARVPYVVNLRDWEMRSEKTRHLSGEMIMQFLKMLAAAFGLAAFAQPAAATAVVDQSALVAPAVTGIRSVVNMGSYTLPAGNVVPELRNVNIGQSVTAGLSGLLTLVQVQGPFQSFNNSVPIVFSLYRGIAGQAGSSLVGSVSRLAIDLPPLANLNNEFGIASFGVADMNLFVHPGDVFSFSIGFASDVPLGVFDSLVNGNVVGFNGALPIVAKNDYAGGTLLFTAGGAPQRINTNLGDLGFRTFVDTDAGNAVPEPSTWAMMLTGFAWLGAVLRRSRRRSSMRTA